jgi:hypothetical protein
MNIQRYLLIAAINLCAIQSNTQLITQVSAIEFAQKNPTAQVLQCTKDYPFNFKPYPLYQEYAHQRFPNQGLFQDIYILSVPNGVAHFCNYPLWGIDGLIFINNHFIKECQIKDISPFYLQKTKTIEVQECPNNYQIQGSLAICSHIYSTQSYGHFMNDVLGQLALLEIYNIQYDYLCIPHSNKFMLEALDLWGIDKQKIIPLQFNCRITADTIIMPTSISQTKKIIPNANYYPDFIIKYIREKLLKNALKQKHQITASKIFISKKDGKRGVSNEDEIFHIFEKHGFKRYEFSKLSLSEKIHLLHNAQEIASFVGSGATNIIFCKSNTKYIEITQQMIDVTLFFFADIFDLQYCIINGSTISDLLYGHPCKNPDIFPIEIVNDFFKDYPTD